MKRLLLTVQILTCLILHGQKCDTVDGRVINCIDINGQKQGLWEEGIYGWRQIENYRSSGYCGTVPLQRTRIGIITSGNYINDKREGTWKYFNEYFFELNKLGNYINDKKVGTWSFYGKNQKLQQVLDREITYNDNGEISVRDFEDSFELKYNNDSSLITGNLICFGDTFIIARKDNVGSISLHPDKLLFKFECSSFKKFYDEFLKLKWGEYNRQLKHYKMTGKFTIPKN